MRASTLSPPNLPKARRTSTRSSTITASGMWLEGRPPGPDGGPGPSPSTALRLLTFDPECRRLEPAGVEERRERTVGSSTRVHTRTLAGVARCLQRGTCTRHAATRAAAKLAGHGPGAPLSSQLPTHARWSSGIIQPCGSSTLQASSA